MKKSNIILFLAILFLLLISATTEMVTGERTECLLVVIGVTGTGIFVITSTGLYLLLKQNEK